MLSLPPTLRIYLARGVTDMRKQIDSLAAMVAHVLDEDPTSGHLFGFCNRGRNRVKFLYWEDGGYWLLHKRLESGRFVWPDSDAPSIRLSAAELHALLGGLDFRAAKRMTRFARKSIAPDPPTVFAT
jgi:transposase